MKVIDGNFGKKDEQAQDVPTSEFLSAAFVGKAMAVRGRRTKGKGGCCDVRRR